MAKKSFSFLQSVFSSTPAAAESIIGETADAVVVVSESGDLSSFWEVINASDADSSDTESVLSVEEGFVSLPASSEAPFPLTTAAAAAEDDKEEEEKESCDGSAKEAVLVVLAGGSGFRRQHDYSSYADHYSGLYGKRGDEEEDVHEDDDEEEDGYGVDDELVPWQVSGKLGKERMRKLGKRACSKMTNAKRDRYNYVKRGCLYGKHKA